MFVIRLHHTFIRRIQHRIRLFNTIVIQLIPILNVLCDPINTYTNIVLILFYHSKCLFTRNDTTVNAYSIRMTWAPLDTALIELSTRTCWTLTLQIIISVFENMHGAIIMYRLTFCQYYYLGCVLN